MTKDKENPELKTPLSQSELKDLLSDIFIASGERDEFIEFMIVLNDTIIKTATSVDVIQQCLPLIGKLRNNGFSPVKILEDFCHSKGVR